MHVQVRPGRLISWANTRFTHWLEQGATGSLRRMLGPMTYNPHKGQVSPPLPLDSPPFSCNLYHAGDSSRIKCCGLKLVAVFD